MDIFSTQIVVSVIVAGLVLLLPGSALYLMARQLFDRDRSFRLTEVLLVGAGLSIAFWPILLLYTSIAGLVFAPVYLWIVLILCAGYILYHVAAGRATIVSHDGLWAGVALAGMTGLALAFRLGDIQGLVVPLFGDSLHHTMVTTLIMGSGRLPTGYLPFVPVDTFTYHFGFHTLSAVVGQLAGLSAEQAVLVMGQVLNSLAVPLAYLLNRQLFGSRVAGLGAALLTGFVSIMPTFYVNWGRYTQLAGHQLLIVALVLLVRAMSHGWRRSDLALTAFCVGGLMVVHYRVLIFFGLFGLAIGAWQMVTRWGSWQELARGWGRGSAAVLLGLLGVIPWLLNVATNYFPGLVGRLKSVTPDYLAVYDNPDTIRFYVGVALPAVALLGSLLALLSWFARRRAGAGVMRDAEHGALSPAGAAALFAIWIALLVGSLWPVPGAIGSYTVAISLYIPLSALGGYGIGVVADWVRERLKVREAVPALALLAAAPLLAIGTGTVHVGDPGGYAYLHEADRRAFQWIEDNTPRNSKFLISSEFSYGGRGLTATDAGMWLPLLAGRNVSVPALSTWMEHPIYPLFFTDTRKLAAYTQPVNKHLKPGDLIQPDLVSRGIITGTGNLSSPQAIALMKQLGITHVYSGAKEGLSDSRLDVKGLRRDTDHFGLVYFRDGVYIFELLAGR